MATLTLTLGIVAIVATSATAFVVANDYHSLEDQGCAVVATRGYDGLDARLVQVRIVNLAAKASLRICVNEEDGVERHEEWLELAATSEHAILVRVDPSATRLELEIDRPGYEFTGPTYVITGAAWTLPTCPTGIADLVTHTEFYDNGSSVHSKKPACAAAPVEKT